MSQGISQNGNGRIFEQQGLRATGGRGAHQAQFPPPFVEKTIVLPTLHGRVQTRQSGDKATPPPPRPASYSAFWHLHQDSCPQFQPPLSGFSIWMTPLEGNETGLGIIFKKTHHIHNKAPWHQEWGSPFQLQGNNISAAKKERLSPMFCFKERNTKAYLQGLLFLIFVLQNQ